MSDEAPPLKNATILFQTTQAPEAWTKIKVLENEGIPCYLHRPEFSPLSIVMVEEEDLEKAQIAVGTVTEEAAGGESFESSKLGPFAIAVLVALMLGWVFLKMP